jgi:hypothetical protein
MMSDLVKLAKKYCRFYHLEETSHDFFEFTPSGLEAFAEACQAIPDGVLKAIDNYGLTLLKTADGYELRKLGKAEAYQAAAPIDNVAEALKEASQMVRDAAHGFNSGNAAIVMKSVADSILELIPDTQAKKGE